VLHVYRSAIVVSVFAAAPAAATPSPASPQTAPTRAALVRNLNAGFNSADTNNDGILSQAELAAAEARAQQERLAAARGRMGTAFDKLDTNHDGTLSKAEFMAATRPPDAAPDGATVLTQLDKNRDSRVSVDEYEARMLSLFDRLDTNHDGVLSPAERQARQPKRS
jgi:hypothetical protein